MEPSGRNRWQIGRPPKPRNQAKTVAVGCHPLPEMFMVRVHSLQEREGVASLAPQEAPSPANRSSTGLDGATLAPPRRSSCTARVFGDSSPSHETGTRTRRVTSLRRCSPRMSRRPPDAGGRTARPSSVAVRVSGAGAGDRSRYERGDRLLIVRRSGSARRAVSRSRSRMRTRGFASGTLTANPARAPLARSTSSSPVPASPPGSSP
jgi:hypothetical protein